MFVIASTTVVVFKKFSNPSILSRALFFSLRQEAHRLFVSVASIVAIKSPFVAFRVKMKTLRKRIRVARLTLSWANNGKNWDPRFDEWRMVGIWVKNWEWKDIKKDVMNEDGGSVSFYWRRWMERDWGHQSAPRQVIHGRIIGVTCLATLLKYLAVIFHFTLLQEMRKYFKV